MASRSIIADDIKKIKEYLNDKSESIIKYIEQNENNENYRLIVKRITHSDLINSGKRNGMKEGLDKNYLYYLSTEEMNEIEETRNKPFESAKQSNIFLPAEFYEFINVPELKRRSGAQTTQHEHPIINDYADVFLVNDTLKYFDINYTKQVFYKLGKEPNWKYDDLKVNLTSGKFTNIHLTHAIHGIGTADDIEFHKLRRSIFKSDNLIILLTKNKENNFKKIFIMLEKNPRFFTIIGEGNVTWEKYLSLNDKNSLYELLKKDSLSSSETIKTRKNQGKWRELLAEEMMSYTTNDSEIFCPLTYITANYLNVGTLFRASHIKAFSDCNLNEAFDINNGILMIANADALFDKHLITINDDGTIIFSYLLEKDMKLIQELRLTEKVFKAILNEDRKKYLEYHRKRFRDKETLRKKTPIVEDSFEEQLL